MAMSPNQNSIYPNLDSVPSWDQQNGSNPEHHPPPPPITTHQPLLTLSGNKPRGRPLGSKNKSKSTSLPMAQPVEPSVRIVKVKVAPGNDVIETILDIAHQSHVSLTVLNAFGTITSATLCNSPHNVAAMVLYGPFNLISLTGSYLNNNDYTLHSGATPPSPLSFGINLSPSQGQVFSGLVGGRVVAGDNVKLIVSTFKSPDIYKYVPKGEEDNNDKQQ